VSKANLCILTNIKIDLKIDFFSYNKYLPPQKKSLDNLVSTFFLSSFYTNRLEKGLPGKNKVIFRGILNKGDLLMFYNISNRISPAFYFAGRDFVESTKDSKETKTEDLLRVFDPNKTFTVGREGDVKINPKDLTASRQHLRVQVKIKGYNITDISTNGTRYKGKLPPIEKYELGTNETIWFGPSYKFEISKYPDFVSKIDKLQPGEKFSVGRNGDYKLSGPKSEEVSRVHAIIGRTIDGVIFIRDINSTNGTYIEGVLKSGSSKQKILPPGFELTIGNEKVRLPVNYSLGKYKVEPEDPSLYICEELEPRIVDSKKNIGGDYIFNGFWVQYITGKKSNYPWKMHLYAVKPDEWQKIASVALPYLRERNVNHKTINSIKSLKELEKSSSQKGKAFTIYFTSKEEFESVAKDLSEIFKENHLKAENNRIKGDKKFGNTGIIFYRYAGESKNIKDDPPFDSES
jgi:pSer/pThr/pTyr-binding forkhead associated (FHA) protein